MTDSNFRTHGGYTSLPASSLPGSVPAAPGPDHMVLPFQGSNLETFPPSNARSELLGTFPPFKETDGNNAAEPSQNEDQGRFPRVLRIATYKPYFNVDTSDVSDRILWTFLLNQGDFIKKTGQTPDLYGPFWICTTLIFVTASLGNYATYIMNQESWYFEISKVNWAAGLFYGYVCIVPLALYFLLKYLGLSLSAIQLWCLYGYSLFVFIPASVLSLVPVEAFKWASIAAAGLISASFVALSLKSEIGMNERSFVITVGSFALQCLLAFIIKVFFFQ